MSNLPQLKSLLSQDQIKTRFNDMLGKKASGYMSSIVSAVSSNQSLQSVDVNTVMQSAFVAASLDLPINASLGFAYIVPYGGKAQFQIGWKGFVQLAMRTGLYKTMNTTPIYEGQLISEDPLTGMYEFDFSKKSEKIIGYAAYFKMLNGFEKTLYMTVEECTRHGKRYSKTFAKNIGRWKEDFDAMAMKTVIKQLLSKYGMLSIEMTNAYTFDQSVVNDLDSKDIDYIDNNEAQIIQAEIPTDATVIKKDLKDGTKNS